MGRIFLVGAGAVLGVMGAARVRRALRSVGPEGVHARASGWSQQAREFAATVREGMAVREAELREALGVDAGTGQLDDVAARDLLEHPTAPRH